MDSMHAIKATVKELEMLGLLKDPVGARVAQVLEIFFKHLADIPRKEAYHGNKGRTTMPESGGKETAQDGK